MCHSGEICSGLFRCLLTIWIRGGTKSVGQRDHVIWSDQFRHFKPRGSVWVVWVQFDPSQPVPQPLHALGISWHINWRKKATARKKIMCTMTVLMFWRTIALCDLENLCQGFASRRCRQKLHRMPIPQPWLTAELCELSFSKSSTWHCEKRRKMLISKTLRSLISHDIPWYRMISHDISWYLMISRFSMVKDRAVKKTRCRVAMSQLSCC